MLSKKDQEKHDQIMREHRKIAKYQRKLNMARIKTEADASAELKKMARANKFILFKIVGSAEQENGIPDFLGCLPDGRFLAIEVKLLKKRESKFAYEPKQDYWLKTIKDRGGVGLGVGYVKKTEEWVIDSTISGKGDTFYPNLQTLITAIRYRYSTSSVTIIPLSGRGSTGDNSPPVPE